MTRAAWLLLSSWGFCAGGPAPAALRLLRALLGAEVRTLPWDVFARGVDHTTDPLGGGEGGCLFLQVAPDPRFHGPAFSRATCLAGLCDLWINL